MTDDVKFCKDCKFYKLNFIDKLIGWNRYGLCSRSSYNDTPELDYLITGNKGKKQHFYASTMRLYHGECGKEARWFEPKEKRHG